MCIYRILERFKLNKRKKNMAENKFGASTPVEDDPSLRMSFSEKCGFIITAFIFLSLIIHKNFFI